MPELAVIESDVRSDSRNIVQPMRYHLAPSQTISAREQRMRRELQRQSCRLEKAPSGHWTREWHGVGYMIIDDSNTSRWSGFQRPYDLTLDEVESVVAAMRPGI